MTRPLDIDLHHVSFSRHGAYLCITARNQEQCRGNPHLHIRPGLWLRNFHDEGRRDVFFLEPVVGGKPVDYTTELRPDELRLVTDRGRVLFCFCAGETLRIRTEGAGLRLSMPADLAGGEFMIGVDTWRLNCPGALRDYTVRSLSGTLSVERSRRPEKGCVEVTIMPPSSGGTGEAVLIQSKGQPRIREERPTYEQERASVEQSFEAYLRTNAVAPGSLHEPARTAAYINWSSVLAPCGHMTRYGMLMSKNWMGNIWSWDHCFNAVALAATDPDAAWNQFMVIFDHQLETGQIPDMINDTTLQYNNVKPPVHGWAYDLMTRLNETFAAPDRLRVAYEHLSRWSLWWLNHRDPDHTGLPCYHHGNDSGWDNGTVFDVGCPVRGPDLAGFLVRQMDVLAGMAGTLDRPDDATEWRRRGDRVVEVLLDKLWIGESFVTRHALTGVYNEKSRSLINCMPIVIADRLPADVRDKLVESIRGHLTDWGLATEQPDSKLYEADGYWRGPIWPSPTFILIDALRTAGEVELADTIAERFVKMCRKSGFSENYNALTGDALRDRSYTWASSLFLMLAGEWM
ncbi:MAG: hypothetical protein R6V03_03365 [Kiritimatiellia bacterium]